MIDNSIRLVVGMQLGQHWHFYKFIRFTVRFCGQVFCCYTSSRYFQSSWDFANSLHKLIVVGWYITCNDMHCYFVR